MKLLGLDTSTKVATAAVIDGNRLVGETYLHTGNDHSQHLMPLIEGLLRQCQVQPKELTAIAVALGPGSFTGLRIGLATGKAFASALKIPLVGIPTLDGLAYNLAHAEGIVCPILDARKKQVYTSIYSWNSSLNKMERHSDYLVIDPEELVSMMGQFTGEDDNTIHFLGDGVPVYQNQLANLLTGKEVKFAHLPNSLARAAQIAWLGIARLREGISDKELKNYHFLTPLYLRASEAEVNLQLRQKANISGS
ncbi:MAG: tRNA (adenosine(37)-N6)-threonylcarbamoyltransferase complex dimerization subunit type 1 TsaB [Bacillota bacterium]|nr:tRNA (adenosine(37)-N6)-threonylcarbamoyltransferase complex dimerization subunit type 1 TsaB [Bacillota bacterium]